MATQNSNSIRIAGLSAVFAFVLCASQANAQIAQSVWNASVDAEVGSIVLNAEKFELKVDTRIPSGVLSLKADVTPISTELSHAEQKVPAAASMSAKADWNGIAYAELDSGLADLPLGPRKKSPKFSSL